MTTYNIDIRFTTRAQRTDRVLEVGESFGLGLNDKEFVVFDNAAIDIEQGDVVYITGESGAGKSVLLRELSRKMQEQGLRVADIDKVHLDDRPIVEQLGTDLTHALHLLGMAGINDANLYIREPRVLSDGQRYRLRLAMLIGSGAQVWTADEFLAVLDRTTAKNVAFNMQKIARSVGATLMVATTHDDMVTDLAPNLTIIKRYREKVEFVRAPEGFKNASD
jgi:ABC-type ATPase with predicted acetyltransferase domain